MILWIALACAGPSTEAPAEAPAPPVAPEAPRGERLALRNDMLLALREQLGSAYEAPVPGLETANPEAGRALYLQHCAGCHGENGRGAPEGLALEPPVSDLTHAGKAGYFSDAGRLQILRTGFTGSAMQGFAVGQGAGADLSEPQLLELYAFVKGLRRAPQPGREPRERPPTP